MSTAEAVSYLTVMLLFVSMMFLSVAAMALVGYNDNAAEYAANLSVITALVGCLTAIAHLVEYHGLGRRTFGWVLDKTGSGDST